LAAGYPDAFRYNQAVSELVLFAQRAVEHPDSSIVPAAKWAQQVSDRQRACTAVAVAVANPNAGPWGWVADRP
jgi:hypothetical protein